MSRSFLYNVKFSALTVLLLFVLNSCSDQNKKSNVYPKNIECNPPIVQLDTAHGYKVNSSTGHEVRPLISALGDTIITGKKIIVEGSIVGSNLTTVPVREKAGIPKIIPLNRKSSPAIINNQARVMVVTHSESDSVSTVLISSIGDTLETNKKLKLKGKYVKKREPKPVYGQLPRSKDIAKENFQFLGLNQGLTNPFIHDIFIDKKNVVWLATLGGVIKYNGSAFTRYSSNEGMNGKYIMTIEEDHKGNLWFGTYEAGLIKYDGVGFTQYSVNEGFSCNEIRDIEADDQGNIWIGTAGKGLAKFDGEYFTYYSVNEGLTGNYIRVIRKDRDGKLWFGTRSGLTSLQEESFVRYTDDLGLIEMSVTSIAPDHEGNIWFGGAKVLKFDGTYFTQYLEEEDFSRNFIYSMIVDRDGDLWLGSYGSGIFKYSENEFVNYDIEDGITNSSILSIKEDKSGNIWFGTAGGGVTRYKKGSFSHIQIQEALNKDVLTITEDKKGLLWFGFDGSGFFNYDGKSFRQYLSQKNVNIESIWTLMSDSKGNIWLGTNTGVVRFDGEYFEGFELSGFSYEDGESIGTSPVQSLFEDARGNIWIGTSDIGIIKYDGEAFIHYRMEDGLSSNKIWSITEDQRGNLWFAGSVEGGLMKFDGKFFTNYTEKEGLSSNTVWKVLEGIDGNIWIGTSEGISVFDGESFANYTVKEGLTDNMIWWIEEDLEENIWVGTQNGISVINRKNNKKERNTELSWNQDKVSSIRTLGELEGLKVLNFFENSILIDHKGRLWAGSESGVVASIDLNSFHFDQAPPVVQLDGISIMEEFVDYTSEKSNKENEVLYDSVIAFTNVPTRLELPFKKNHLTFYFSVVDYSAPDKIKYSYKIEGLNKEWSLPSKEVKADYRNIPYGTYTFKVCAIKEGGEWSKPVSYSFIIKAPVYLEWWAITGYIVLFILIISLLLKWRIKRLERQKKHLKQEVQKATHEIKRQKDELKRTLISNEEKEVLLKEVHHRVKNNLQIINSLIRLQSDFMNAENFREKLKETEDRIQSMRLIHEMLYKSEDFTSLNVKDYIHELKNNIVGANEIHIKIAFKMEIEALELGMDLLISLGLIINEIFSNSLKHAFPNQTDGSISLKLVSDNNKIHISIDDNGIGSEVSADVLRDSSLGMDLIWSLADQLDAEISVETGKGFCYELVLPYEQP